MASALAWALCLPVAEADAQKTVERAAEGTCGGGGARIKTEGEEEGSEEERGK